MKLRIHDDIGDFRNVVVDIFCRDPVAATVELTVLRSISADADPAPLLVTVWLGAKLVGATIQTPPYPLLCSGLPRISINDVVAGLVDLGIKPSGVRGPRDTAEAFAAAWCAATGGVGTVSLERLYRLNTLVKPAGVEGHAHAAGPSDFDVLTEWLVRFGSEAFGEHLDQAASARSVQAAKGLGDEYLLWTVQDRRVSMAAVRSPVAGVSRIGPVYTPTAERGRGYGSAVTAAAALWGRQHGADDVVLFADVANPTSNHIYQRIGFQLVSDYARINFDSPG